MKIRLSICVLVLFIIIMSSTAALTAGGMAFTSKGSVYYLPEGAKKPIFIAKGGSVSLKPDGSTVVYAVESTPKTKTPITDIIAVDIKNRETHRITSCKGMITDISWNADGKRLL
ncbi:MAG: hypothetical protein ACYC0V_22110 [Armatimonadota bacterium]